MERPILFINVDSQEKMTFCSNRCNNMECSKHQINANNCVGICEFIHLRDTAECVGYVPKRRKGYQSSGEDPQKPWSKREERL